MEHLCATLFRLLRKFINDNFDGNVSKAARALDLSYYRAREVYNGTAKSISFIEALRIFQTTGEVAYEILAEVFPVDYATYLKSNSKHDSGVLESALQFLFTSNARTELYSFVSSVPRIEQDVLKHFGDYGALALAEMVKNNILSIDENGTISSLLPENLLLSGSLSRAWVQRNLESMDSELRGTLLHASFGSVNLTGWRECFDATQKYLDTLKGLYSDPKCKGNTLVISSAAFGPLARVFNEGQNHD